MCEPPRIKLDKYHFDLATRQSGERERDKQMDWGRERWKVTHPVSRPRLNINKMSLKVLLLLLLVLVYPATRKRFHCPSSNKMNQKNLQNT